MNFIEKSRWKIASVLVDNETVLNNEGFQFLQMSENEMAIEPLGFRFTIEQTTPHSAVLFCRGRLFHVAYSVSGKTLNLQITRPGVSETISMEAELEHSLVRA